MKQTLHLIKQHDYKDCGAACLSMILEFYGKKISLAKIREAIQVDKDGANLYGVLAGARQFELEGDALEGNFEEFYKAIQNNEITLPVIARVLNHDIFEHYVVVSEVTEKEIVLYDPDGGKRKLSHEDFSDIYLGQIMTFSPMASFKKENQRKGTYRKFAKILLDHKGLVFIIGILSLIITAIGLAGAFVFQYLIDDALHCENEFMLFIYVMIALGILYLFKMGMDILRGKLLTELTKKMDLSLILGFYEHMTKLPMNFFSTRKTGEIITRFQDASKIQEALASVSLTLMIDVVLVLGSGFILYDVSSQLFWIAMVIFGLYVAIVVYYIRPLKKTTQKVMENNSELNSYLKESVDGMETVKAFSSESSVFQKGAGLFHQFIDESMKNAMYSVTKESLIECVTSIGTLAVLYVGATRVFSGMMTIGELMTFYSLMQYFLSPVQNLVDLQATIQNALVAIERLNDVLELSVEKEGLQQNTFETNNIEFDHVDFRYGQRQLILKDMSFKINEGEHVAFVGESGCGKSTITKLLMNFYQPEKGTVKIAGIPIQDISISNLRKNIAYISQNTFLFSSTIRENLTLGLDENVIIDDEDIYSLLEKCGCEFVEDLPFGIDTVLEENGMNLSGGQRQRLSIVRALMKNPKILIMDEATSALDPLTEKKILQFIRENYPHLTILMVAHRLGTIKDCDRIYVVEKGCLIEEGLHQELLDNHGVYANLYTSQNN